MATNKDAKSSSTNTNLLTATRITGPQHWFEFYTAITKPKPIATGLRANHPISDKPVTRTATADGLDGEPCQTSRPRSYENVLTKSKATHTQNTHNEDRDPNLGNSRADRVENMHHCYVNEQLSTEQDELVMEDNEIYNTSDCDYNPERNMPLREPPEYYNRTSASKPPRSNARPKSKIAAVHIDPREDKAVDQECDIYDGDSIRDNAERYSVIQADFKKSDDEYVYIQ